MNSDRFYFYSFVGMAILCLGGFVPSFFLRPLNFDDPLPVWMIIHGTLFTLWYVIAIAQSWLILKGKPVAHRELGVVATVVAFSAFILTFVAAAHLQATGRHITGGAGFNAILTTAFTLCVAVGVYLRRKPEIHKRLMIMATVLLTVPGFDRLIRNLVQPSVPTFTTKDAQLIVTCIALAYIGFMIYRDLGHDRRPLAGTALGFACFIVGGTLGSLFVGTEMWAAMVASFSESAAAGAAAHH